MITTIPNPVPIVAAAPDADMIVLGGGIVGTACALALRRSGRDVLLVDPDTADPDRVPYGTDWLGPASLGNAGHIATEQVRPLADPDFLLSAPAKLFRFGGALDLGWPRFSAWLPWSLLAARACLRAEAGARALSWLLSDALPAWRRLAASLDAPTLLRADGHLMLWHDPDAFRAGAADWRPGRTGTATAHPLSPARLDAVARHLSHPPAAGLCFRGTGQVSDPVAVLRALRSRFEFEHGRVLRDRAVALPSPGGTVVLAGGAVLRAPRVLLASGVGTAGLLRTAGLRLPLVAERGYHLEWRFEPVGEPEREPGSGAGGWDLPPLVFPERALIVSRFGDRLRASSFVEFDREHAPPDPRKWHRLEHHVRALGLPVASPFRRWMGARPTLPDYLPALGVCRHRPDLLVATGHNHLGLTLAPRTAELVLRLADGTPPPELRSFDPNRFDRRRGVRRPRR